MKKLLVLFLLVISSSMSYAQTGKGTVFYGASLTASNPHSFVQGTPYGITRLSVTPRIGLFVTNRFALGVVTGYSFSSAPNFKSSHYSAGLYGRYYLMFGRRFGVFGQATVYGAFSRARYENQASPNKMTSIGIDFTPGAVFFLSDRLGLEATVGRFYFNRSTTMPGSGGRSTFNTLGIIPAWPAFSIGLHYHLGRKKAQE